jgi:RNA polymerase sigma-70 factor (ECF subfamily)
MNSAEHFEAIVCEHYQALFRFAMSLTRMESDARDLTQQTFYVWATKGHQLRDITKVKTWLFTTLHRAFLESRRREQKFSHQELDQVSDQLPVHLPEMANHLDGAQVLPALARVDDIYQAAVALFYLDNCSYKDIAAILEIPVGTVKSRIARGIGQLRNILLSGERATPEPADRDAKNDHRSRKNAVTPAPLRWKVFGSDHDEWNLSSTLLPEPILA